jgi:hypothetical protein
MYNMMMSDTRDRSVVPGGTAVWNRRVEPPCGTAVREDDHIGTNEKPDVAAATLAR